VRLVEISEGSLNGRVTEDKVILTVATTGGVARTKERNTNVPEQPDEIAKAAYECWKEGASILHIHARDKNGIPTGDPKVYSEIHARIRDLGCDIIIQDTTGTGPQVPVEDRILCLQADPKPEMASLDMGTMVRNSGPYKEAIPFDMVTRLKIGPGNEGSGS